MNFKDLNNNLFSFLNSVYGKKSPDYDENLKEIFWEKDYYEVAGSIKPMSWRISIDIHDLEDIGCEEDLLKEYIFCLEITLFGDYTKRVYGTYNQVIEAFKEDNERFGWKIDEIYI